MDGNVFKISPCLQMLLYRWAALCECSLPRSPSCFCFYRTGQALSLELLSDGTRQSPPPLRPRCHAGCILLCKQSAAGGKASYWASLLAVRFCCWQVNWEFCKLQWVNIESNILIDMTRIFLKIFISPFLEVHWEEGGGCSRYSQSLWMRLKRNFVVHCLGCPWLSLWDT